MLCIICTPLTAFVQHKANVDYKRSAVGYAILHKSRILCGPKGFPQQLLVFIGRPTCFAIAAKLGNPLRQRQRMVDESGKVLTIKLPAVDKLENKATEH